MTGTITDARKSDLAFMIMHLMFVLWEIICIFPRPEMGRMVRSIGQKIHGQRPLSRISRIPVLGSICSLMMMGVCIFTGDVPIWSESMELNLIENDAAGHEKQVMIRSHEDVRGYERFGKNMWLPIQMRISRNRWKT